MVEDFLVLLVAGGVRLATPLLLAALGETISEKSGVMNLSIEGLMSLAAFVAYTAAVQTQSQGLGLMSALLLGLLWGLLFAFVTVTLHGNQIVMGFSLFIFAAGLSAFLFRASYGTSLIPQTIPSLQPIRLPLLADLPVIGVILFSQNIFTYGTVVLVPLIYYLLFRTRWGLKVRAVGDNPRAADAQGVNVYRVRYVAVLLGSLAASAAGAYLVLDVGFFRENMVAGRGFLSLAIVIFGNWNPIRTLIGAIIFGTTDSIQIGLQILQVPIGYNILQTLPYVLTIVVLIILTRRAAVPGSLTQPYRRGE
ncbi:MAG: ABC transporter permease [Nitrososphaerota archaeon]